MCLIGNCESQYFPFWISFEEGLVNRSDTLLEILYLGFLASELPYTLGEEFKDNSLVIKLYMKCL